MTKPPLQTALVLIAVVMFMASAYINKDHAWRFTNIGLAALTLALIL